MYEASTTDVFLGNYEFFKIAEAAARPVALLKRDCNTGVFL